MGLKIGTDGKIWFVNNTLNTLVRIDPQAVSTDASISKVIYHKVAAGDTLWNIAQKYNTTIQEIKKANGINGSQIKIGSKLKVPVTS